MPIPTFFPPAPNIPLTRQLSLTYTDPYTGRPTSDDPQSYEGLERRAREDAIVAEHPDTGYAKIILESRCTLPEPRS